MKSGLILWVDEAGRGAWAGSVVAGACVFLTDPRKISFYSELADSKTLSEVTRESLFDRIEEAREKWLLVFGVGMSDASVVDLVGIREANRLAMDEAMRQVFEKVDHVNIFKIRIDGRDNYRFDGIDPTTVEYIVRGDSLVKEIQAAAIVAKVSRDRLMCELDLRFPEYGFARHKGYGTKAHQDALAVHGSSIIHRQSYAPIKKLILAWGSV